MCDGSVSVSVADADSTPELMGAGQHVGGDGDDAAYTNWMARMGHVWCLTG
jgi:hypothetical protein